MTLTILGLVALFIGLAMLRTILESVFCVFAWRWRTEHGNAFIGALVLGLAALIVPAIMVAP